MKTNFLRRRVSGVLLRISLMFLAVLLLTNAITLIYMNRAFNQKAFDEILRSQNYSMQRMQNNLEAWFTHVEKLTEDVIYDENIQNALLGYYVSENMILPIISVKAYQEDLGVVFVDNRGNAYCSTNVHVPGKIWDNLQEETLFTDMHTTYSKLCWGLTKSDMIAWQLSRLAPNLLAAGRQVRHLEMDVPAGYVVFQILPSTLEKQLYDPLMRSDTRYFLLDESNHVIYDSQKEMAAGEKLEDECLMSHFESGSEYFYGNCVLGDQLYLFADGVGDDFRLLSCLPKSAIADYGYDLYPNFVRIMAFASLVALALSVIFSVYLTRPIREIVFAMRKVRKGELDVSVTPRHSDELGELAESFNRMTESLRSLMERTRKDEAEMKYAEISALIYQINPHFIYNTLDNINILAKTSSEPRMSVLITELSSLLRITLSGGKECIPVGKELEHVGNYLRIMQLRSGGLFRYEFLCGEGLEKVSILKLILQPIAENTVQHGFQYLEEHGLCRISVSSAGKNLLLAVEDNGLGMSGEDMQALKEKLKRGRDEKDESRRGVGLQNVYRRLLLYYGAERFSMDFSTSELGGLMVEITLREML